MPSFATSSIFVLIFFALGLSVMYQGFFGLREIGLGGEKVASGFLHLLTILLLSSLVYLSLRWFRLRILSMLDLRTMISLTFGLFAFTELFRDLNSVSTVFVEYRIEEPGIYWVANDFSRFVLSLIFGFSLLLLSSRMLRKTELDGRDLQLAAISLSSYGIMGLSAGLLSIFPTFITTLWIGFIGGLIRPTVFLLLAVDILFKRILRRRSVYLTFLLVGVADLMNLLQNGIEFAVSGSFYDNLIIPLYVAMVLSYLLAITVSAFLVMGGRWEGRNFTLSLAAIFLFTGTGLLGLIAGTVSQLQIIIHTPSTYEVQWRNMPTELVSATYLISLLTIGFLLYRQREQWAEKRPLVGK